MTLIHSFLFIFKKSYFKKLKLFLKIYLNFKIDFYYFRKYILNNLKKFINLIKYNNLIIPTITEA